MKLFNELVLKRRSVRLMSGESITNDELKELFEAFRWAPSAHNDQPWRIIYAQIGTKYWEPFLGFLEDGNRRWVRKGAVILIVLAKRFLDYKHKVASHHWFDCGAACQNMALQATARGLSSCVLGGFDEDSIRKTLGVSDDFDIPVMMVIGRPMPGCLEKLKSIRKLPEEIFSEGIFQE